MWYQISKRLLKLSLVLSLLLCFSFSAYSQDVVEMTDQELLTELTTILTSLETDNQNLTETLSAAQAPSSILTENLKTQEQLSTTQEQALNELKTSWENFKKEELKKKILIGTVSGLTGIVIGFIIGSL